MRLRGLLCLCLLCGGLPAVADDGDAGTDEKVRVDLDAENDDWNARVRGNTAAADGEGAEPGPAELTLTVYDRRRGKGKSFGPVYDGRGQRREVEVTSELESCPDGNTRVAALRIGTWRYRLEGDCSDFRSGGHITVSTAGGNSFITTRSGVKKDPEDESRISCEAATWTCRVE